MKNSASTMTDFCAAIIGARHAPMPSVPRSPLAAKRLETSRLFDPFDAALQAVRPVLALIAEKRIIISIRHTAITY
jgi:hypothetical protein